MNADFADVCQTLEELWDQQDSDAFKSAVKNLEVMAQTESVGAAEFLAEILANEGPCHDAAAAYKWYYRALSSQGYSVEFADQNGSPPRYRGPNGDFRNESMVNELVAELGFEKVLELDRQVIDLLRQSKT